jgi:hypothetical protein
MKPGAERRSDAEDHDEERETDSIVFDDSSRKA